MVVRVFVFVGYTHCAAFNSTPTTSGKQRVAEGDKLNRPGSDGFTDDPGFAEYDDDAEGVN